MPFLSIVHSDTIKQSYHIVVKGIHFNDHNDCGEYAKNICRNIDTFDSKVYSTKRNLRLMFSRKRDATRIKQFHSVINYGYYSNEEIDILRTNSDPLFAMKASLVTCIDFESICLSTENQPVVKKVTPFTNLWNDERMATGLALIDHFFPNVFRSDKIKENSIHLTRLRPFHCPLCNRSHDNDGGSLIIRRINGNDKYFFTCFRNEEGTRLPLIDREETNETLPTDVIDDTMIDERENLVNETVIRIKMLCKFI